jgi:hypothetical protein
MQSLFGPGTSHDVSMTQTADDTSGSGNEISMEKLSGANVDDILGSQMQALFGSEGHSQRQDQELAASAPVTTRLADEQGRVPSPRTADASLGLSMTQTAVNTFRSGHETALPKLSDSNVDAVLGSQLQALFGTGSSPDIGKAQTSKVAAMTTLSGAKVDDVLGSQLEALFGNEIHG